MEYFWITSPERGFIKLADELLPELLLSWLSTTFAAVFSDVLLTAFFLTTSAALSICRLSRTLLTVDVTAKTATRAARQKNSTSAMAGRSFTFFSCRMKFHLHGVSIDG